LWQIKRLSARYTYNGSYRIQAVKTLDTRTSIQHFLSGKKYFTLKAVRKHLAKKSLKFKDQTLRQYLHDLKAKGTIHDAGYGWYSTIATTSHSRNVTPADVYFDRHREIFTRRDEI